MYEDPPLLIQALGVARLGGREDVEAVAAGVEEAGHVDEGADLAEGAAADHPCHEVLGELPQDGPDLLS